MLRRSRYDREILGLAIPALGALAAEPLYVLVDTAIVGHLGTPQLASLAIAATVLTTAFTIFNFLTYGTTAQVARLHGAGQADEAAQVGAQAQWLALIIGIGLVVLVAARMIAWAAALGAVFGVVLLVLGDAIPHLFTSDEAVVARTREIWWLFAALMPLNGAVFALDGILIGAGDTRFLMWGMLAASAVYIPIALLALDQGWGIVGVWSGLAALIVVRLATCGGRFLGERWALTGASRAVP